jgi:hypothetical protein
MYSLASLRFYISAAVRFTASGAFDGNAKNFCVISAFVSAGLTDISVLIFVQD